MKFQNTVVIDIYIYFIIIVFEAYPFINHVYWTGPAFSGWLPGVAESGLMDSERVSSSERTRWTSSWTNCEGRSSWLKPERIDYSQKILDNLISIKGFRTSRILQEDVKRITNEYTNSKRFLSLLKHVCSISCLWINWFKQHSTKSTNQKKKVMYNRDWKKVERYIENQVLGFSVHLPPFEWGRSSRTHIILFLTDDSSFFLPLHSSVHSLHYFITSIFVPLLYLVPRFHFTTLVHPQESKEMTPEMSFGVAMSVLGGGLVLARVVTVRGSRSPRPRWWFLLFRAGHRVRSVRPLGIVGWSRARSPMFLGIGGIRGSHRSFLTPSVFSPAVHVRCSIGRGLHRVRGRGSRGSSGRGPAGSRRWWRGEDVIPQFFQDRW